MTTSETILTTFLKDFPVNATSWSQATDEIRDLAYRVRSAYNEYAIDALESDNDPRYVHSLPFKSFSKPSQWNMEAIKQIVPLWHKLPTHVQDAIANDLKK
jgi:hypothetical protein